MYRKNTGSQYIYFVLVNASTGAAITGATVTAYRALDDGSQASATGTTTELANGQYRFDLSQADTNANYGSYLFTATNAVPVEKTVVFTAANPTDAAAFGLSKFGDIETDTQDIQSRLPAALVSGRMDASVGAMAANTLTASALATDAVDEIVEAVFAYQVTQDQFLLLLQNMYATVNAIEVDTQNIQSRLPSVLVSGRIDASVGAMAANTITASALATDAVTEIQAGLATSAQLTTVEGKIDTIDNFVDTEVAAVKGVTDKLDTTMELDGAVYRFTTNALEQSPTGGSASVNVLPASVYAPTRGSETILEVYVGETINQALTVYQSDGTTPLSLAGKTLEVVFDKFDGTDVVVVPNSSITVSGASNNVATFAYPSAATELIGIRFWALRDASAPKTVYAFGQLKILQTAFNDP